MNLFEFKQKTAAAVERQSSGDDAVPEKVKVYVRIRPLSKEEQERAEDQVIRFTSPHLTPHLTPHSTPHLTPFTVSWVSG